MLTILSLFILFNITAFAMKAMDFNAAASYFFGWWVLAYICWAWMCFKTGRKTALSRVLSYAFRPVTARVQGRLSYYRSKNNDRSDN